MEIINMYFAMALIPLTFLVLVLICGMIIVFKHITKLRKRFNKFENRQNMRNRWGV